MTAVTGRIITRWPNLFDSQRGDAIPDDLFGATIVAIGTMDFSAEKDRPEGGGLVIDYIPKGTSDVRRITLAFTELGMWRHPLPSPDGD